MDGPYRFKVHADSGGFNVALVEHDVDGETTVATAIVDAKSLIEQVVSAGEIIIQTCRREQWIDDDLVTLETLVGRVRT